MTRIPTPSLRGVFALLFAVGIVTAAAGSGMFAGTGLNDTLDDASPVSDADACGGVCVTAVAVGSVMIYETFLDNDGGGVPKQKVEKIQSLEAQQQKLDLHALAVSAHENAEQFRNTMSNGLLESRSIASMKAKKVALEMLNNGTHNATKLTNAMHESINDYYAVRERNMIAAAQAQTAQLQYIVNASRNDSNIRSPFLDTWWIDRFDFGWATEFETIHDNVTLVNGTTVNVTQLYSKDSHSQYTHQAVVGPGGYEKTSFRHLEGDEQETLSVQVDGPNESLSAPETVVYNYKSWGLLRNDIQQQAEQMRTNYNISFAQQLIDGWRTGKLTSSDIVTPEMLAQDYSTAYNKTGASVYQWASLASMGLDSPDIANVSHMTVDYIKSTDLRYVTLTPSGNLTALAPVNLSVGGEQVATLVDENGTKHSVRVPIPLDTNESKLGNQPPTVTLSTYDGFKQQWSSARVENGETTTIEGLDVTASKAGHFLRVTESGMLFARNAPNGTWQTGTTYNASTISGTEFFAPAGKFTRITRMSGNFTIQKIVTDSGESVGNISTRNYNYQTANASEFTSQLQALEDIRKDTESREPTVGGGSGSGGNQSPYILVALFALGAALLYYNRGDTDG